MGIFEGVMEFPQKQLRTFTIRWKLLLEIGFPIIKQMNMIMLMEKKVTLYILRLVS